MVIIKNSSTFLKRSINILLLLSMVISPLYISGCSRASDAPEEIVIGGTTYRSGFYGSMYPNVFEYLEESNYVKDIEFHGVEHSQFEFMHAWVGPYSEGMIYCNKEQLGEAEKYYSNPDNYTYFCKVGVEAWKESPYLIDISDIDMDIFEALIKFAEQNSYDPFDSVKNDKIRKIEMPMPDEADAPTLCFYKESKDGMFVSSQGEEFHIVNGELLLVFYYDGHGEYEKMIAVKAPAEISEYMVEYLSERI